MAPAEHEEVAAIPARELCSPLPGRGILSVEFGVQNGRPTVAVTCDCGTETQTVIELPDPFLHAVELPLSCDGCSTVTWMTARPQETEGTV